MKYLRWEAEQEEGYCVIATPGIDIDRELREGEKLEEGFPNDAFTKMRDNYPDDIDLADNLYGSIYPIVSEKLKQFLLEKLPKRSIEFPKVSIVNHKGRIENNSYYFLHPLIVCDCIDIEASEVDWNDFTPELIAGCMGLVLREKMIPNDLKLFRLKHWGYVIIISSDLAEELAQAGFTGLYFPEAEGYDGI